MINTMATKKTTKKVTKKVVKKPVPVKKADTGALRKKTFIFFGVVVLFVIIDIFLRNLLLKGIAEVIYFAFAIVSLVYSIKLVRKKDYKAGVPILVISGLIILFVVLMFLVGLIIGVMMGLQGAPMY